MLSMSDSRTSEAKLSVNEHSVRSNVSEQSPATHENSNVAIYEVRPRLLQ